MTGLFERNNRYFSQNFPELWDFLRRIPKPISQIEFDKDGQPKDLLLMDTRLYGGDAAGQCAEQLQAFLDDPDRVRLPDPRAGLDIWEPTRRFDQELQEIIEEELHIPMAPMPVREIGYSFIFGVGLGLHVPKLVDKLATRTVVFFEPIAEFMIQSWRVVDWQSLLEGLEKRGGKALFIVGQDTSEAISTIETELNQNPATAFMEGSYAYMHYPSGDLVALRHLFNERLPLYFVRPAGFEDEKLMIDNARLNASRQTGKVLEPERLKKLDRPVVVVGAGPSLDRDLPSLGKIHDKVIIISSGSGLGILLKNGIRPDFHIENENKDPLVKNLETFAKDYDLEGITLLASITVPEQTAGFFDDVWYYFRRPLAVSHLFNPGWGTLAHAGPLAANAAASAAFAMGASEIYLMGCDCGRRPGSSHHSKDAIYYSEGYDNFIEGESHATFEEELTRIVPGNFGGDIESSAYMDLSRQSFTQLIEGQPIKAFNCSDGAEIKGFQAQPAQELDPPRPTTSATKAIKELRLQLADLDGMAMFNATSARQHLTALKALRGQCKDIVSSDNINSIWQLYSALEMICRRDQTQNQAIVRLMWGAIQEALRLGIFYGTRLAREEAAETFYKLYRARLSAFLEALFEQAQELFERLD